MLDLFPTLGIKSCSRRLVVTHLNFFLQVGFEAQLVLDGRVKVPLDRGVEATLECNDEHALWSFRIP